MRKVKAILSTNGSGYWSEVAKDVKVIGYDLAYVDEDNEFGELRVYFDTKTWDCNEDGLIYTDRKFKAQLMDLMTRLGFDGEDIDYSEQGMQGSNFVSFDVCESFIKSYNVTQLESML
jgi:hypothetical protein